VHRLARCSRLRVGRPIPTDAGAWVPVQGKEASVSTRRSREDVLGHGGEETWRFAQGPIERRAKRHTVLLRDLRAFSLLLRVEKLACLTANVARCRTVGCVPSVHRWCQSEVRRTCLVAAKRLRCVGRRASDKPFRVRLRCGGAYHSIARVNIMCEPDNRHPRSLASQRKAPHIEHYARASQTA